MITGIEKTQPQLCSRDLRDIIDGVHQAEAAGRLEHFWQNWLPVLRARKSDKTND